MNQRTSIRLFIFGACRYNMHKQCDVVRNATGAKCTCFCHDQTKLHADTKANTKPAVPLTTQLSLFRRINFRSGGVCLRCGESTKNFGEHILKCAELGVAG